MTSIHFKTGGRLRQAIAATALMAGSGFAAAEPVSVTLEYTCPFPLIGDQAITAEITSDMPAEMPAGEPTGEFFIDALTTVPENAKTGLSLVGAVSVEGTAESSTVVQLASGDMPLTVLMEIPQTQIPVDEPGSFTVPASGVQESLTFTEADAGPAQIAINELVLNMVARTESGEIAPAPIGEFTSNCTLNPGQDNILHTFEVTSGDTAPEPQDISLSSDAVDFGNAQAGLTEEQTITVSNAGDQTLGINGVSISGADASAFMQTNNCTTIAAGESCGVTVTYFPSGEGAQNATLSIQSDDPDSPSIEVPLTGTSVAVAVPEISVEPAEVNFGPVQPGLTSELDVVVSNLGAESLGINGISIGGTNPGDFMQTNDCTIVAPEESCTVTVTFMPAAVGERSAVLTVASDDPENPSIEVPLLGEGDEGDTGEGVEFLMDVVGSTTIAASDSTLPLSGTINALLQLSTGMYTADLALDPTEATIQISQLFRKLKATAQVEFEQVEETTGTLIDGVLTSNSKMYIEVPKVTVKLFGFDLPIGGGAECRTMDPVTISLESPEGEEFAPLEGGSLTGTYNLPPLENCGALTGVLNHFMAGPDNTINLELTPNL